MAAERINLDLSFRLYCLRLEINVLCMQKLCAAPYYKNRWPHINYFLHGYPFIFFFIIPPDSVLIDTAPTTNEDQTYQALPDQAVYVIRMAISGTVEEIILRV